MNETNFLENSNTQNIDEEIYKNAKYEVQKLIKTKKKTLFEE